MKSVRTRFAPSPTGPLHLGHALAAKVARDLARASSGEFLLRHEDIDATRVREEFYREIETDLDWLELRPDAPPLRQTSRLPAYEAALQTLRELGVVYPCFCTRRTIRDEIAAMAAAPHGPEGPLYPGTCRNLAATERTDRLAAGQQHAWRLDAAAASRQVGALEFHDLRFGRIAVDPLLLGDVVLARKDIGSAYHLAVVVDDAFQTISHVTRGEDLLGATHVHRILQALLEFPEPIYLHHPLVLDASGKRLAKRDEARTLASLRDQGVNSAEILARCDSVFTLKSIPRER